MPARCAFFPSPSARTGTTLIELLLALVIAVLVMGLVYSVYHTVSATVRGQTERLEGATSAATALLQMSRDLSCTLAPAGETACAFLLQPAHKTETGEWRLEFCSSVPSGAEDQPWQDVHHFAYVLSAPDPAGRQSLRRESRPLTGPDALLPPHTNWLARHVLNFQAQVFDGETWQEEWPVENSEPLPRSIRLEGGFHWAGASNHLATEIWIPAGNTFRPVKKE